MDCPVLRGGSRAMTDVLIVLVTAGKEEEALAIARAVVE